MKCSKCGRENRDDATYCFACKSPLSIQGYAVQPVVDERPIYQTEYERTDKYYEEPSPNEPEDPIYSKEPEQQQEQESQDSGEEDDIEEFYEYYVPEDLEDESEEDVAIYEAEDEDEDVELTPLFAEDLEEEEASAEQESPPPPAPEKEKEPPRQQTVPMESPPPPAAPPPPETENPVTSPIPEKKVTTTPIPEPELQELKPLDDCEVSYDTSDPQTSGSEDDEEPDESDNESEPGDYNPTGEEEDDDGDFVISTPKPKPVIVFDDDEEDEDYDDDDVLFDETEDDEDFEIVTSRKIDPKQASNIALIQTIMSKVNNLKKIGKDVKRLEEKMAFVLTCRDEDKKLMLAKACLADVDKLDKETDQEIFEETADKFHAMRARLIVLAKKGRDVNRYSDIVEDASQAISMSDFAKADRIITEVMAELERY